VFKFCNKEERQRPFKQGVMEEKEGGKRKKGNEKPKL